MSFDLSDLCQLGGVTARTVRYYVQQGLLPSPGLGAGARYGEGHLARLRLIRRMQAEHLPLAEIRRRLEELDDAAVQALLEAASPRGSGESAVDYVRSVLGASGAPARPATAARAQWERIALAPDIELHVRRPLSREDNRRVERLLERAQELFREEED